jgi:hypothetical protein
MRIWEHTVDELTGGKEPLPDQDVELPEFPFDEKTVVPITQNLRYATALAGVGFADQAAAVRGGLEVRRKLRRGHNLP